MPIKLPAGHISGIDFRHINYHIITLDIESFAVSTPIDKSMQRHFLFLDRDSSPIKIAFGRTIFGFKSHWE